MYELDTQRQQAEEEFIRKLGKLRYLNNLRNTNEVEDCPACCSKPEHKVSHKMRRINKIKNVQVSMISFNYFSM